MLRFSPTAWAKLLFLRDYGETEVGGFGISAADDLLSIEDFRLVKQVCSWVHVSFEDAAVADFFDEQVDFGRTPQSFGRTWIHSHPGDCPLPSSVDEETFERVFGKADWALMMIVARGGETYARLRYNHGPKAEFEISVGVDYSLPFAGSDHVSWEKEYRRNVQDEEEVRFNSPQLGSEFSRTDELGLAELWPTGEFEHPQHFNRGEIQQ